jgi:hypothetical protein
MSRTLPETAILLSSLRGNVCPCCGGRKRPNTSLCFAGYGALTRQQKNDLYKRFGEGYEAALETALETVNPGGSRHWPEPKEQPRQDDGRAVGTKYCL